MNSFDIEKMCKDSGLYDRSTTLCAFSNGQIFSNANLLELKAQANTEGLTFYLLKGEMPEEIKSEDKPKSKKNETKD